MAQKRIALKVLNCMHNRVEVHVKNYQTDLLRDIETITQYKPNEFLWCERESGTQLIMPNKYLPTELQEINQMDALVVLTYYQEERWILFTNVFDDQKADWDGVNDKYRKSIDIWNRLNEIS